MPTLCWIAPEIPQATYSFGETVLPVWPTWVEYGYQPASTTARVAATAPPSALRERLDEREVVRTAEAAAARDDHVGVLDRRALRLLVRLLEHRRLRREVLEARRRTPRRRRSPPASTGSNVPGRKSASRGVARPAHVDEDRVLERRPLADELAVRRARCRRGPSSGPRRAAPQDRRRRRRRARTRAKSTVSTPSLADQLREHVDARLRQRRLELRVVRDVDLAAPTSGLRRRAPARPSRARRRRRRRRAKRPCRARRARLLQLALVVLEEDQRASQELLLREEVDDLLRRAPSSSILRASPRGGGSPSASTVVPEPASRARRRRARDRRATASPAASTSRP